jgi:hypothetical protein
VDDNNQRPHPELLLFTLTDVTLTAVTLTPPYHASPSPHDGLAVK